jgi:hypothetical protein
MVAYDGKEYLIFEVAALKETDQFGKTHTVYISNKVAVPRKGKPKKAKPREKPSGAFFYVPFPRDTGL